MRVGVISNAIRASPGVGLLQLQCVMVLKCGLYPQAWGYCMSLIPRSRMRQHSPRCRSAIALTGNDFSQQTDF